jgi:hypothetical protein
MKEATYRWFAMATVAVMALGMAACSGGQDESSEGEAEHASSEAAAEQASAEGTAEESSEGSGEHARSEGEGEGEGEHARSEGRGEHGEGGEGGEGEHGEGGEEGEESGVYIGRGETWDAVRRGARLVLKFDPASNAFAGTVENTTAGTLCSVRVEVHLSTGTELGPTPRTDVPSGQKTDVTLATGGEAFDTWTAHPEVSACGG